ncbi:MAG: type II toxin-antitoxin system RelE/ParE family toxin [Saprospiraceae bacterium]
MKYKIKLHPIAKLELIDTFQYYEDQQKGLGRRFLKAYQEKTRFLADNPEACELVSLDKRRAVVNPFKYNVIYQINISKKIIVILAVMHGSRSPKRWQDRK